MMIRSAAAMSLACLFTLGAYGCSGDAGGGPVSDPSEDSGTSRGDSSTPPSGNDSGSSPSVDSATPPPAVDAAQPAVDASRPSSDGGGKAALAQPCKLPTDCASGRCEMFRQNTVLLCTNSCTPATQATDCPNPPTVGTCTPKGYCKIM